MSYLTYKSYMTSNARIERPAVGFEWISSSSMLVFSKSLNIWRETNITNKFGRAIQQHGYHSFTFEILEEIRFAERQELYDLEDVYITKYDSINNGFNARRNERKERGTERHRYSLHPRARRECGPPPRVL